MTCIVGLVYDGNVYMGADSAGIDDDCNVMIRLDRKLFRKGEFVIGFAGSYRMGQVLQYQFSMPSLASGDDLMAYMVTKFIPTVRSVLEKNGVEDEPSLLVGVRDRLFLIDSDSQVAEHACGYAAIGVGAPYGYASLHTSGTGHFNVKVAPAYERVRLALQAAATFNASVAEPFYYEQT